MWQRNSKRCPILWGLPQGGSSNKYESALSLMGVSPEAVLVFENDVSDVENAVLAGVPRRNIFKAVSGLE